MNMRQNYRMSYFIISRFNTHMFYQIKRTARLEFIPLIDVSISIGTVEHKADIKDEKLLFTFTFMHLADAFIQSDLQCIQVIHLLSVCVFPGNWTHNLSAANAVLCHWATGTQIPCTQSQQWVCDT